MRQGERCFDRKGEKKEKVRAKCKIFAKNHYYSFLKKITRFSIN